MRLPIALLVLALAAGCFSDLLYADSFRDADSRNYGFQKGDGDVKPVHRNITVQAGVDEVVFKLRLFPQGRGTLLLEKPDRTDAVHLDFADTHEEVLKDPWLRVTDPPGGAWKLTVDLESGRVDWAVAAYW